MGDVGDHQRYWKNSPEMGAKSKPNVLQALDLRVDSALAAAPLAACAQHVLQGDTAERMGERTAEDYMREAYAQNTYRSYRASLRDFVAWSGLEMPVPVTATLVVQYLTDRANSTTARVKKAPRPPAPGEKARETRVAPSTLAHRVAAISFVHRLLGYPDPTESPAVAAVLKGIRKTRILEHGWSPDRAPAFTLEQLRAMVEPMGDSLHDLRDRAFILVGLFGAFRQSELTGLDMRQLTWHTKGVVVEMGVVKQDQTAERPRYKALPRLPRAPHLCPVTALRAYLDAAGVVEGAVFRGTELRRGKGTSLREKGMGKDTANRILKKWAARGGLPDPENFSDHSFRASFVTVARSLGIADPLITRQSHHLNVDTLQVYDRPESAFDDNPAMVLGEVLSS